MLNFFKCKNRKPEPPADTINKQSSFWSNLNIVGKLPSALGTAYWLGLLIDTLGGLDEDFLGLSKVGLIVGSATSIFTTGAAIYCEYQINNNNTTIEQEGQTRHEGQLKPYHHALLACYWLDQVGDKAAAAGLFLHIIGGDKWSRLTRSLVQSFMAGFGFITSTAEYRTAKENLKTPVTATTQSKVTESERTSLLPR